MACRNEARYIEPALQTLLVQEKPVGDFEIIIADGMSDDGTREIITRVAAEAKRLRMIDNPDNIVSTGLNAAIASARGRIIVRMDAHSEYAPDYVRQCVAALDRTGAANVGGPWIAVGRGYVSRAIAAAFQCGFTVGGGRAHRPEYEGPVDTVYLGCWHKELFHRIGLFDPELVRNQDDEHNLRIIRAGERIWQSPAIRSMYYPRSSLRGLAHQFLQYGYWKVRVIQKHKVPASIRHLVPGGFVALIVLLLCVSIGFVAARWALVTVLGVYLMCVIAASLLAAGRAGMGLLPILPAVIMCFHFPYGWGFLWGLVDFGVLRRAPRDRFRRLTR